MSTRANPIVGLHHVPARVIAALALALPPIAVLQSTGAGAIDPTRDPISEYVNLPYGFGLLALALGALVLAAVPLICGLARLPQTHRVRLLLVSWSAAVTLAAVFPTNPPGTPVDLPAVVHRYAGAWLFVTLPIVGWLLAQRLRPATGWSGPALGLACTAGAGGVLSTALVLNHLPILFGGAGLLIPPGLLQRFAVAMQVAMLVVSAFALARHMPLVSAESRLRRAAGG
jgi:hypothetical protein